MYDYDRSVPASRRNAKEAMEFSSPEALKTYLKDHPQADPKNHSVSKGKQKSQGGGKGSTRKNETAKLIEQYSDGRPGMERKVKELKSVARELDKLEEDYSKLGADEHHSMQRKLEETYDKYAKLLEHCTGVKQKKPWYYDR